MTTAPRRRALDLSWLLGLVAVVVLAWGGLVLVEWAYRPGPNYTEIEPGLYLGGYVTDPPAGTRAVLNLCETEDPHQAERHRWEPIADAAPAPSLDWLREQVAWIDAQRRDGRPVYVHCRNGVSRSAMVLAAYLMWRDGLPVDDAVARLRRSRPIVRPNPAFRDLLGEWEREK